MPAGERGGALRNPMEVYKYFDTKLKYDYGNAGSIIKYLITEILAGDIVRELKPIQTDSKEIKHFNASDNPFDIIDDFIKKDYIISGEYIADLQDNEAQIVNAKLCSYVIGMIVPGKNSLFMDAVMQVKCKKVDSNVLSYKIAKKYYNPLLGVLKITVELYSGGGGVD